jgi:uracil-DNA glycosylase family 4
MASIRCEGCPLKGQQCSPDGPEDADLMIVGEAPGGEEIRNGVPFSGRSGTLLNATLKELGLPREKVFVTNVVMCRQPKDPEGKDKPPTKEMIRACSARLDAEVARVKPKVILPLGATAAQVLWADEGIRIGQIAGAFEYSKRYNIPVIPTYHPAAVLHGGTGFFDNIYTSMQRAVRMALGESPIPPKEYGVKWEFVDRWQRALEVMQQLWIYAQDHTVENPLYIALDTESHGPADQPRAMEDDWDMMQLYWGDVSYSIKIPECGIHHDVMTILDELLQDDRVEWIFHNAAHDQKVLLGKRGITAKRWVDTMVYALGLTEKGEEVGLKSLSRQWLNAPFYEKELKTSWKTGPLNEAEWLSLAKYGAYDAYNTYELRFILPPLVEKEGTLALCEGLLHDAQELFATIPGTNCDLSYAQGLEAEWLPILDAAEKAIQDYAAAKGFPKDVTQVGAQTKGIPCPECCQAVSFFTDPDRRTWRAEYKQVQLDSGCNEKDADPSCKRCMKRRFVLIPDHTLNVRSPKQLQHLCYDILGMTHPERGKRSCDDDFFTANETHEFTKLVRALREKDHLLRNYIRGISDDVWSDGLLHPDFLLFGTVTGRLSIRNPPMQTLPKWGTDPKLAKMVRKLIIPSRSNMVIVEGDFSNLELYISHHYSQDPDLLKALTEHNFHTWTASKIFNVPYEQVTGDMRFNSKFVTFGIAYGRQAWSLAQAELYDLTGGSVAEAQKYVDNFWAAYPKYKEVYDSWIAQALEEGVLSTPMGRRRRWRLIMPQMVNHIRNQAVNFPIQSLASDTCLSALCRINRQFRRTGMGNALFTVHDSIVAEVRRDCVHEAIEMMRYEMTHPPYETTTPFKVDFEIGPSLGEVESYKRERSYA